MYQGGQARSQGEGDPEEVSARRVHEEPVGQAQHHQGGQVGGQAAHTSQSGGSRQNWKN